MGKHGGSRNGAGRKPKADEVALIERLTPLADLAYSALEKGLEERNPVFVKLWFEYFHGKPNQQLDVTSGGEAVKITFSDAS